MAFTLRRGTLDDIPGMLDVWFRGFNSPEMLSVLPDSTPTRAWVGESIATDMKDETRNTVYMIMTDDEKNGKVVSLAKWIVQPAGGQVPEWNKRWPAKVAQDMSEEAVAGLFFEPMARQHEKATGDKAHYFLEVLATHDEYRKRGLASQLLRWGSDRAEEKGVECYLDSAPAAKSLYEKHGYVLQPYQDEKAFPVPMLRPAEMTVIEKVVSKGAALVQVSMTTLDNAA